MFLPPADGCPTATAAVASTATPVTTAPSTVLRPTVMSCVLPSLRDLPRTRCARVLLEQCRLRLSGDLLPRAPVPSEDFAETREARNCGLLQKRDSLLQLERHGLAPD